ncbi:gastrula zinc finger protein XlCGF57.1-like [Chrysoperla carnea]|uniref:gastrula zinc finger protein XlCGF57.1-like n=1 Tax=Chrysoperla carnea TaxID=189513 RepID=UPI001D06E48A|nr:gastrula zinc finger protein XlCGF57.1-like [Chrysoperla carnea]
MMVESKVVGLDDFETICRICLNKKENMSLIFENSLLPNLIKTYREMLEECASVHILTDDSLPKKICFECIKDLEQSYKFKIQYLSTEKLLEQIIANAQPNIKVEELAKDLNKELNYKCEECGIGFQFKAEFYKHQKLVHSNILKFQCKICKKVFGCKGNLRDHLLEHATCKICGKSFKSVRLCNYHLKIHGDKRHLCTYCGKSFTDKGNYNVHLRTHTGEKKYQCTQCGKRIPSRRILILSVLCKIFLALPLDAKFINSDGLRKHSVSHSDERKFQCEICKKTYKRQETLISHRHIHREGVSYSCDICNKQFKRKDTLRDHKKIHTGERNYICTYCNKAFMKTDNLKMHLRTHTGEKPFTCSKCGKRFSQKHVLNSHMKTHFELPE